MRKTLFAMLGLVALGLWVAAPPAVAAPTASGLVVDGPAKVRPEPISLENRAGVVGDRYRGDNGYQGTLSGTLIKQTTAVTSWFLYPGACVERAMAPQPGGIWAAKLTAVADSLQNETPTYPNSAGYVDNQPDIPGNDNRIAYTRADQSLAEKLWHIEVNTTNVAQRPALIDGIRFLWCGKFDANWAVKVGYPNLTFQILYFDTGVHAAAYDLTFTGNCSAEIDYDYFTILGGGSLGQPDHADPLQNRRDYMSDMLPPVGVGHAGPHGDSQQIITYTGSTTAAQTDAANTDGTNLLIKHNSASAQPATVAYTITGIEAQHRALYFIFTADCLFSSEDGLWPLGSGQSIDLVEVSDQGTPLYNEEAPFVPPAGVRPLDLYNGTVLKWSGLVVVDPADDYPIPLISSRVPAGVGELWQLAPGTENVTSDICSPQKALSSDLFFEGGDPNTNLAINKQFNSIVTCTFPIPAGTASVFAQWNEYLDLPRFAGYVQYAEYRYYKGGSWSLWENTAPGGGVTTGANQAWVDDGDEIAKATQADSVQVRFNIQCIPPFAADRANCAPTQANALLYDNLRLQVTTGVPAPIFGIFPGSVAQSTFVDGTIDGTNCTVNPCWPGNRGSALGNPAGSGLPNSYNIAVHDNWNAATGDTITLALVTGLQKGGMGINWRLGFDKSDPATAGELGPPGSEFKHVRTGAGDGYNPAVDVPRMIFRLFDPTSKNWSPWDSTELIANAVQISDPDGPGPAPPETILVDSEFNMNWPPYDKAIANATLPGGFTVNTINNYNGLRFLPRGLRMQYYWKAVDIAGGVSYQFASDNLAREVDEIPTLPGSSIKAPDIITFSILPGAYPAGPAGSLLAGRTNTPILNLDRIYSAWAFGYDPVTQALRALGVRADRWRFLASGTTANGIGGHELPGKRPDRLSNFFPNYQEYPIADSLAAWYRIMIESGHTRTSSVFNEQDATLAEQWWRKETGSNGGDRCFFVSGDDVFNTLLNTTGVDQTLQISLSQQVFGVSTATNAWSGTTGTPYPIITDTFAGQGTGGFTYPVDGGCPGPNRFDALVAQAPAIAAATYPNAQIAGMQNSRELDTVGDNDRNKALAYGLSIQLIREPSYGPTNFNYGRSGVENRMRVLYRFLTACRGAGATAACWPCPVPGLPSVPSAATMQADWSGQAAGFNTATNGPLYPIQAGGLATAVELGAGNAAPRVNWVDGHSPNPFNPHTTIRFASAHEGKGKVQIYSVSGRLVRTMNVNVTVGANEVRWNGKQDDGGVVASGVYFYKIAFPNGETLKAANHMVLVK